MNFLQQRRPAIRKAAIAFATLATSATMISSGMTPAQAAAEDQVVINLLDINDFHGRIDANTVKFAGTVEQLRSAGGDANTLFLSAGDNIGASLFASASQQDKPTLDVLNALDLKASAIGNHELDQGVSDLSGRVQDAADYDYLAANIYEDGTQNPVFDEFKTYDVAGVSVAVIGAITEEAPSLVSPAGIANVDFGDPVDAVNRVTDELKDSATPPDIIVASFHEGAGAGTPDGATLEEEIAAGGAFARIAQQTDPDVDAIFTGHTHKEYVWDAPVPGTDHSRPIVQTGSYGERIGQVKLTYDTATDEVEAYNAGNVARTTTADDALINAFPRVKEVDDIVDAALAQAAVIGGQPVGKVSADITTAFVDSNGDGTGDIRDDRANESTLGNLVANSLRESVGNTPLGADFGVVNPGGLRSDLFYKGSTGSDADVNSDGVITYAEANAVLPFANNLHSVSLTGAQFTKVLEQQWQTNADGTVPSRPYLQLGLSDNVTYTYDAGRAQGNRVNGVFVNGAPIDAARTYKVATFSFLATGGDNFRAFKEGTTVDTGLIDRDAWIKYLDDHKPLAPSFARRAVGLSGLADSYKAGETVNLALTKLDLTSLGSPKNTTVTATLKGSDSKGKGTTKKFPVTNGGATIAFPIPKGTSGAQTLTLTADPSGTSVKVPLTVDSSKSETTIKATAQRLFFGLYAVTATVTSPDGTPKGVVGAYDGNKVVGLGVLQKGKAVFPVFKRGGPATVKYLGNDKFSSSTTTVDLPN